MILEVFIHASLDVLISFIKEWGGWIIGIASIIVMILLAFLYSRRVVKISCILEQPTPLFSVRKEVKDLIKIFYREKLVENLNLLRIKIRNDGNVPIRREHIVKPIEFNFGENANVIDYSVISTDPDGIDVELKHEGKSIKCYFDLLNPKDEVTLQFVCVGDIKKPKVSGRIEGLRQIEILPEEKIKISTRVGYAYMVIGLSMIVLSVLFFMISASTKSDIIFSLAFAVYGILILGLGIMAKRCPKTIDAIRRISDAIFLPRFPRF